MEPSRPAKRARNGREIPPAVADVYSQQQHAGPSITADTSSNNDNAKKQKKVPLSCAECRRLKLKCDRVFPCQSCCKRGCSEICPDGALTSGRGSRFILANTEQLHEKIVQLSERVRQLEDALETLQTTFCSEPHPLLRQDLLRIKTSLELYTGPGGTRPTATCEPAIQLGDHLDNVDLPAMQDTRCQPMVPSQGNQVTDSALGATAVPPDILQLSSTFPVPWQMDMNVRQRIRDLLPARPDCQLICEQARQNALWQYNLDASETFLPNLIHHVYTTRIQDLCPRRLALLLMILAIGSLVDLNQAPASPHAEMYHHLARASITAIPLMEEPNFDLLHALFFMIWYLLIFSDSKKAVGYAYNMMGLTVKLAQSIGLHRDGSRLKVIPEEYEKRRTLFWELMNLDCRISLSLGRPPSLCLVQVDTKPPCYTAEGIYAPTDEVLYHEWKHTFFVHCLSPVLNMTVAALRPDYADVMELDSILRDFPVPRILDSRYGGSPRRFLVMQRALVTTSRDIALLQLHRTYFAQALSGPETFSMHCKYAPSVVATYLSATSLISAVETLFNQEPQLSMRFLCFWFNAFSGAVALCLFVSRAPSAPLAPFALQELERVCQLFRRIGKALPFGGKALPVLERLADKSRRIYIQWRTTTSYEEMNQLHASRPRSPIVPAPFVNVHPSLSFCANQTQNPPPLHEIPTFITTAAYDISEGNHLYPQSIPSPEAHPTLETLPSIYEFNSAGIGIEDSSVVSTAGTLYPAPPPARVTDNQIFNFDFGALSNTIDTSYMAWF